MAYTPSTFDQNKQTTPVMTNNNGVIVSPFAEGNDNFRYANVSKFDSTYYAGINVQVWFDDILYDDVVNLQYQVIEQVMPIFSYARYTYNFAARGSRVIQGSFSINFKRASYLLSLLNNISILFNYIWEQVYYP